MPSLSSLCPSGAAAASQDAVTISRTPRTALGIRVRGFVISHRVITARQTMRESAVSIPQFASPPFVGPYERKESSNSESAVKVEIEIGVETRERGVGVRGAELEEEGRLLKDERSSGLLARRSRWPRDERNWRAIEIIARGSFCSPSPSPLSPSSRYHCGLGDIRRGVVARI